MIFFFFYLDNKIYIINNYYHIINERISFHNTNGNGSKESKISLKFNLIITLLNFICELNWLNLN